MKKNPDSEALQVIVHRKPLVRLLQIIARQPISTRRLLEQAGSNKAHDLIKEAQKQGLIHRIKVPQEEGLKGNDRVLNEITAKGRKVVDLARQLQ